MRTLVNLFAAAAAVTLFTAVAPQRASAQAKPIELGLDGTISFGLNDPSRTDINLPVGNFRIGFMSKPNWEIEPFGSFNYADVASNSTTLLNLGVGALYLFQSDRTRDQWYVRPFLGLAHASFEGGPTGNQFELGGGAGVKVPLASQFGLRFEATFTHLFEGGDFPSASTLGFSGGFSFYTR